MSLKEFQERNGQNLRINNLLVNYQLCTIMIMFIAIHILLQHFVHQNQIFTVVKKKKKIIIHQVIDWANEITYRIAHSIREKNPDKSKKLRRIFIEKDFYTWFGYLEEFFKKNSNNSFFIGELSIADITAWRVIRWFLSGNLEQIDTKFIEKFPNLKSFYENFSLNENFNKLEVFKEIMS